MTSDDKTESAWADFHIRGFSAGLTLSRELAALRRESRHRPPTDDDGDDDNDDDFDDDEPSYLSRIISPAAMKPWKIIARLKSGKTILVAETSRRC
jgi:hypothetical protein